MNGKTQRSAFGNRNAHRVWRFWPPAIHPPPTSTCRSRPRRRPKRRNRNRKRRLRRARVAAANAERAVNDVAAGVKQGLDNKTRRAGGARIDLNHASEADLASLPGISLVKPGRSLTIAPTPPRMTW